MKQKRNDIYSGIVFLLFGIFVFVGSYWIPATTSDILGSRFFPRVVAILIGILSLFQITGTISSLKEPAKQKPDTEKTSEGEKPPFNWPLILTTIALFVYYILILQIGFTITSILYLLFEGLVLTSQADRKNKKQLLILVLVAIIVPVFLNTIFWNVFTIALPAGAFFE